MDGAGMGSNVENATQVLNVHLRQFMEAAEIARLTGHTVPTDTKSWSQILVSTLTEIPGLGRKKGSDLADGSDVKAANVWEAIDTPRFNGVLRTGRLSARSRSPDDVTALDGTPYLFFVLWDYAEGTQTARCRIWAVSAQRDLLFRALAGRWYQDRANQSTSANFQLHPPRNLDHNRFSNTWGTLAYPLLFAATYDESAKTFIVGHYDPGVLTTGECAACDSIVRN